MPLTDSPKIRRELSANETSRHPKVLKIVPEHGYQNMAIFSHFSSFLVTFLVVMDTFMQQRSTKRTQTLVACMCEPHSVIGGPESGLLYPSFGTLV